MALFGTQDVRNVSSTTVAVKRLKKKVHVQRRQYDQSGVHLRPRRYAFGRALSTGRTDLDVRSSFPVFSFGHLCSLQSYLLAANSVVLLRLSISEWSLHIRVLNRMWKFGDAPTVGLLQQGSTFGFWFTLHHCKV